MGGENEDIDDTADQLTSDEERAFSLMLLFTSMDCLVQENKAKRPLHAYLPFGLGPHVCIGMRLALIEAKLALINMLQSFRFLSCDKTEVNIVLHVTA
jgi:hypothetical protein